jgi:hypothetical protein
MFRADACPFHLKMCADFTQFTMRAHLEAGRQLYNAVLAQTLASRAYHALNRVCLGEARRVRFKSRGRG